MMVKSSVTNIARENALLEELADSVAELRAVRYRFQGREWSEATGLANFRMRWYDAVTGRWLSKDPIGLSGGLNLYAFCGGDAVDFIDPLGLAIWVENRGLHQNINVGDPNGNFDLYSFGADGSKGILKSLNPYNDDAGIVYNDDPPDSMEDGMCISTTPEQDEFAKDFLDGAPSKAWLNL